MKTPENLAMAIVVRSGSVLVQRRYRLNRNYVFEFPGGTVENDESAEDAAIRELYEETGMTCNEVLGKHTFNNEYGGEINFIVLLDTNLIEARQVSKTRQQTFYWYGLEDIPLADFYAADKTFVKTCLGSYLAGTM